MFVPLKALIHCTETLPHSPLILFVGGKLSHTYIFVLKLVAFPLSAGGSGELEYF